MGGTSNLVIDISGTDGDPVTGDFEGIGTVDRDQFFDTHMGVVGATHLKRLDKTSYIKSGAAVSRSVIRRPKHSRCSVLDTVAADEFYYRVDSAPKIELLVLRNQDSWIQPLHEEDRRTSKL